MKLALAKYLARLSSVESTNALVKTILFSPEKDVRDVAIAALKARRDEDASEYWQPAQANYADALLQGFRYPWQEVAARAAYALVKLDRKDLAPRLIDILDEPDPRAPIAKDVNGKTVTMVREIVRINHHRNCLMCHAPGQDVRDNSNILTAEMPLPGQEMPSPESGGYGSPVRVLPQLLIRTDVTYLRQDFSMMLRVAKAAPWPEMQRFDFFVRTRTLEEGEVQAYKDKFDINPGFLPPNVEAALAALRKLTGKDTGPTAEAWRRTLAMK